MAACDAAGQRGLRSARAGVPAKRNGLMSGIQCAEAACLRTYRYHGAVAVFGVQSSPDVGRHRKG